LRLVGSLQYLLSNKVVARVTKTGIQSPVVGRELRALDTLASNSNVSNLAEAAALIKVFVVITGRVDNRRARLGLAIIDLVIFASSANSIDQIVTEVAHASLL
jgi:hypothetical protein